MVSAALLALSLTAAPVAAGADAPWPMATAVADGSAYALIGGDSPTVRKVNLETGLLASTFAVPGPGGIMDFSAGQGRLLITRRWSPSLTQGLSQDATRIDSYDLDGGDLRTLSQALLTFSPSGYCGTEIVAARPLPGGGAAFLRKQAGNPPVYPDSCGSPTDSITGFTVGRQAPGGGLPMPEAAFDAPSRPIAWQATLTRTRTIFAGRGWLDFDEQTRTNDELSGHASGGNLPRGMQVRGAAISSRGKMAIVFQRRSGHRLKRELRIYSRFGSLRKVIVRVALPSKWAHVHYCGTKIVELSRGGKRRVVLRSGSGKALRTLWSGSDVISGFSCDGDHAAFFTWPKNDIHAFELRTYAL